MALDKKTKWRAEYNDPWFARDHFDTLKEAITEILEQCEHQADITGDSVADTFFYHCKELIEVANE